MPKKIDELKTFLVRLLRINFQEVENPWKNGSISSSQISSSFCLPFFGFHVFSSVISVNAKPYQLWNVIIVIVHSEKKRKYDDKDAE
jgi:hypothetical protein